ncbi:MAG: NINE protein [Saprospiraceae bacterium]
MRKNKNTAAILSLFFGAFGVHRFYLGQTALGILYIFGTFGFWFFNYKIILFISLLDAIRFLTMDPNKFNRKFNRNLDQSEFNRPDWKPKSQPKKSGWEDMEKSWNVNTEFNSFKKEGIENYKAYNFQDAIVSFEKALQKEPTDAPTLFNMACSYSMIENKALAFKYLGLSVQHGMKDFQKILSHDGLAYLRIQSEWDNFVSNDFKAITVTTSNTDETETETDKKPESATEEKPIETLRSLYESRQKGLIDEEQFELESKKLLHKETL